MSTDMCPRCGGPLDNPALDEPDSGSSYLDDQDVVLCFDCRTDELARHVAGSPRIEPADWPIRQGAHDFAITFDLDPDGKPGV